MPRKKTIKYESQALAIAMVIMVVSSIIAMSVFFRSQKDRSLTLEERASAEALEISDLIIDKLTPFPIDDVIALILDELEDPDDYVDGTILPLKENSSSQGITTLFSKLGISDSIRNLSICPVSEENNNEYEVTIKQADENTYFEIRPGQIWSFPIKGLDLGEDCDLNMGFEVRGNTGAGFVLTKSYAKEYIAETPYAQYYKDYNYEDIINYCFSNGSECNDKTNFLDDNWTGFNVSNKDETVRINLKEEVEGYVLDEVRIKAVGGTIGLKYSTIPNECISGRRMMQLRVSANCYGIYRGKEVLIPEAKWHNVLFDYAVFNGEGSI